MEKIIKINYRKDGKVSSILEKDNWLIKSFIQVIILGLILFVFTDRINDSINPNPIINKSCYKDGDEIVLTLSNPSKIPAEDFNMILFERYGGGSKSYADHELCDVDTYKFQPLYTLLHCDYIPPKSDLRIGIGFENKTQSIFQYSSWGKTSPKEDYEKNNYALLCT